MSQIHWNSYVRGPTSAQAHGPNILVKSEISVPRHQKCIEHMNHYNIDKHRPKPDIALPEALPASGMGFGLAFIDLIVF